MAGRLMWAGAPLEALYRPEYFFAAVRSEMGYDFKLLWLYPPYLLPVAALTALAEFRLSFHLWVAASLLSIVVLARMARLPWTMAVLLAGFPASLHAAMMGQTSGFVALFMGAGLIVMDRRPAMAGLLFGLVCIKPHMAVLIPVFLAVQRRWTSLLAFCITGALFLALPAALLGIEIWAAFLSAAMNAGRMVLDSAWGSTQPSIYVALQRLGGPRDLALAVHALAAGGWILLMVWRLQYPAGLAVRSALLCFATLSVSPYLFAHDLTLLAIPLLALFSTPESPGLQRLNPITIILAILIWIFSMRLLFDPPGVQLLMPPLAAAYLIHASRRSATERSGERAEPDDPDPPGDPDSGRPLAAARHR